MAWIEVHQTLPTHRKIMKLKRLLKIKTPQAIGHAVMLWLWSIDNAPDGDLSKIDAEDIAEVCDWPKKRANELVTAMQEAELIDADMRLHDWEDYAGRLIDRQDEKRQKARERQADYRARKRAEADSANGDDNGATNRSAECDSDDSVTRDCHAPVTRDSHVTVTSENVTVTPLPYLTLPDQLSNSCSSSRVCAGHPPDDIAQARPPVTRDCHAPVTRDNSGDVPSPTADPELGKVMSFYLDRINANPSQTSIDGLKAFAKHMDSAVIIKAMEYALDEHKAVWSYIKATLEAYQANGIRTLADWQREKDNFEKRKGEARRGSAKGPPAAGTAQSGRRFKSAMDGFD